MNQEKRDLLRVISILLQYPDQDLILNLDELRQVVETIAQPQPREQCTNLLNYLGEIPLIRLQEEYTSCFDLNPATCLNLTYHKWGDARERGGALVDFVQLYHRCGYQNSTGELPDYLPLVLEFLSIDPQENQGSFLGQYCDQVETIGSRLQENGSPYAGLIEVVGDAFREFVANGA
jgi:nitrate reductase delta subunit